MTEFPLFPFFLSAYSILALMANNITEVQGDAFIRPLLFALSLCGILLALTSWLLRDRYRAGLVTAILIVPFYSYGHIYNLLRDNPIFRLNLGRHGILFPIALLAMIGGVVLILRLVKNPRLVTASLNGITLVLCVLPLIQIGAYKFSLVGKPSLVKNAEQKTGSASADLGFQLSIPENQSLPDIYYIIPDMYGRHDALMEDMGYDNSSFLDGLRDLGFVIADCSRSNYAQTTLSLTSALNMDYLVSLGINDERELPAAFTNNRVRLALESIGYRTIVLESGYRQEEMVAAGIDLLQEHPSFLSPALTPFEMLYLRTTLLRTLLDVRLPGISKVVDAITFPFGEHAARQEQILQALEIAPSLSGPKFVYAHIMIPHPPFIFAPDGSLVKDALYYREAWGLPSTDELFQRGYTNQVEFISRELLIVLKKIIQDSPTPPIIILQGDHGIRYENRMEILNAYYLPGGKQIYSTITPVNTFRLLLGQYFDAGLELLPDRSYYSEFPERFDLREVPEHNPRCISP